MGGRVIWSTRKSPRNKDGQYLCTSCNQWLDPPSFGKNKYRWNGLTNDCRVCRNRKMTEGRHKYHGTKPRDEYNAARAIPLGFCKTCGLQKALDNFYRVPTKRGYMHECKGCQKIGYERRKSDPGVKAHRARQIRLERLSPKDPLFHQKAAARGMVLHAIKGGFLLKQPCATCGAAKVEAHHNELHHPR